MWGRALGLASSLLLCAGCCAEGEALSAGNCCPLGSEYVPARLGCICLASDVCGTVGATASLSAPSAGARRKVDSPPKADDLGEDDPNPLSGKWCCQDPAVGCYSFKKQDRLIEHLVMLPGGTKPGGEGSWVLTDDELVIGVDGSVWSLEVVKRTPTAMILHDPQQDDTFSFAKR